MPASDFLFEIGTEELPPKSLRGLRDSLAAAMTAQIDKAQLAHGEIRAYATPRRLAVTVAALASDQLQQRIEKRGPSVKAAFDESGAATRAAVGFARSCGIEDVSALDRIKTDKGEWLMFREQKPGAPLTDLIGDIVASAIAALPVERRMRWGSSRAEFVRPVHWLVAMHGETVLPLDLFGLTATNVTMGHRFMSDGPCRLANASEYADVLRAANVITDFDERRSVIRAQLDAVAIAEHAEIVVDEALLDEVTSLVEWPVALCGGFDPDFLKVPEEALISAMKSHQRYFHVVDANGRLKPRFVTIANIESVKPQTVIQGNERVITPRLSDASFFYDQDRKTTLVQKAERLKSIVFQSELGSYHDKALRVSALAGTLAETTGLSRDDAQRAGLLCKADLVSDMVGEFPELQGIMGEYYARHDGESADVARAIAEHYLPTQSGGPLPASRVGQIVAIADKLDTLTGLFGIGQPPTGSRDPFALRRQTLGVIRICIEGNLDLDIVQAIAAAVALHQGSFDPAGLVDYLFERLAVSYQDLGIGGDTVAAVRGATGVSGVLAEIDHDVRALHAFRSHPQAEGLAAANKRVANILKQVASSSLPSVEASMFELPVEKDLFDALLRQSQSMSSIEDFQARLMVLADLAPLIAKYFEDVLVMTDNEKVKRNRMATLARMRELFLGVADFSLLQW